MFCMQHICSEEFAFVVVFQSVILNWRNDLKDDFSGIVCKDITFIVQVNGYVDVMYGFRTIIKLSLKFQIYIHAHWEKDISFHCYRPIRSSLKLHLRSRCAKKPIFGLSDKIRLIVKYNNCIRRH